MGTTFAPVWSELSRFQRGYTVELEFVICRSNGLYLEDFLSLAGELAR